VICVEEEEKIAEIEQELKQKLNEEKRELEAKNNEQLEIFKKVEKERTDLAIEKFWLEEQKKLKDKEDDISRLTTAKKKIEEEFEKDLEKFKSEQEEELAELRREKNRELEREIERIEREEASKYEDKLETL